MSITPGQGSSIKVGFIALAGRPNVGKSTFLNQILEQKISIVSPKVQTTRSQIKGIHNIYQGENIGAQMIFCDLPGIHEPLDDLGEHCYQAAMSGVKDADIALFITEALRPIPDQLKGGDLWIMNWLKDNAPDKPLIVVINKIDRHVSEIEDYENDLSEYSRIYEGAQIYAISAENGWGIEELLGQIQSLLPEGEPLYTDDELTDQPLREIVSEMIREKALLALDQEIPHALAVDLQEYSDDPSRGLTTIRADILIERDSQKRIVIGKGGSKIKEISTESRLEIEKLIGNKVFLELRVKVWPKWRKSKDKLKKLGYHEGK